jgi:pimeloyl-ACP methyl ester carboxylesterase
VLFGAGGPGNTGGALIKAGSMNWPEPQRRYDIVGFDPGGVGGSSPVRCDKDALSGPYPEMPRDDKEFAQLAERNWSECPIRGHGRVTASRTV